MSSLTIHALTVGMLDTNCYLVTDTESRDMLCIDPGGDGADVSGAIEAENGTLVALLITHGHGDHIGGVTRLYEKWNCPVVIHTDDAEMLASAEKNLSASVGIPVNGPDPTRMVTGGETLRFGPFSLEVIHTPGHTPGGVCYYMQPAGESPVLFSGDTLFYGDVGRCDLPGGNLETLSTSIRDKLYNLPDETRVYPGHGPATTIGREKTMNAYVQA